MSSCHNIGLDEAIIGLYYSRAYCTVPIMYSGVGLPGMIHVLDPSTVLIVYSLNIREYLVPGSSFARYYGEDLSRP